MTKKAEYALDLRSYEKRIRRRLKNGKPLQPADVAAMVLPELLRLSGALLREVAEDEQLDTYADDAGIVVEGEDE